jgi:cobalt-zinc-cadmium efflux system outer membrane protein
MKQGSRRLCAPGALCLSALTASFLSGCAAWDIRSAEAADLDGVARSASQQTGVSVAPPRGREGDGTVGRELERLLAVPLSEEAAVQIALLNNRELRSAYDELGIARAELVQAGLLRNPVVFGNAKLFTAGPEIELGLTQSLLDAIWIPLRSRVAAAQLEAEKAALGRTIVVTIAEVRRAHIGVLAAQQAVGMRREILSTAEAYRQLTERLHAAGNITGLDIAAAEALEARARLDLAAAEAALPEARENLSLLLGLWGDSITWTMEGELPQMPGEPLDASGIESRAVASSYDLAERRARAEAAAREAGFASLAAIFPGGEAGVQAKRESGGGWGVGPGGSIALPLFDQGQARSAGAAARLRQALAVYWAKAVEVRSAARRFRDRHLAWRRRAQYFKEVYAPLRARLVRETLRNYNAMQIGAFEVLLVRQQEIEAAGEYLEALREAWISRIDLEEVLAGSLNERRLELAIPRAASTSAHASKEH